MRGKNTEAESAYRESLALREKLNDGDQPTLAMTMNGLGQHLFREGKLRESESLIRRGLDIRRRIGDHGYAYASSLLDLGNVLAAQGRLPEAEATDREGLALLEKFVEPDDHRLVEARQQLARVTR
jgi:tetratricopeptide (TPR) repeat protein